MKKNIGLMATLVLGLISFLFVIFDYLALTDIWHGEADVTGEWTIVTISVFPIVAFHILFVIFVVIPFLNRKRTI